MGILDWFWHRGGEARVGDAAALSGAVDKVIQGTDPRIRMAKGCRARLEPAVSRALAHAAEIGRCMPGPVDLASSSWASTPELRVMFARAEDVASLVAASPSLHEYVRRSGNAGVDPVYCILTATLQERTVLGHALEGETVRADVAQRTVAFAEPRIVAGAPSEAEFRKGLEAWCLEQMILAALERIAGMRARREKLQGQRDLLRARLRMLERAGAGLGAALGAKDVPGEDTDGLRGKLENNDRELEQANAAIRTLEAYLDRVSEVLAAPEKVIGRRDVKLRLDAMNVVVSPETPGAVDIALEEFAITVPEPRRRVALLARVARRDIPVGGPSLEEAMKLLA